jgi:TATA-box binding protein (TBP) (component of TFIID and TFIIIB)
MNIPNFNDISVSTKTIIATTNLKVNIKTLFEHIPITSYIIVKKKRGRKKKIIVEDPNKDVPNGSIITLKYQGECKGADLKAKSNAKKGKKTYFRNALTVVMKVDNKLINFKITNNKLSGCGKFQITGCKKSEHAIKTVKYFWEYIINSDKIENTTNDFTAYFNTVMSNIDFNIGFLINREILNMYINTNTEHNSLLETSFGYTGVNIKIPFTTPFDHNVKKISYKTDEWIDSSVLYNEYKEQLSLQDQKKETDKERFVTFLVFHSGKIIMSGISKYYMEEYFYYFIEILDECKDLIREQLDN